MEITLQIIIIVRVHVFFSVLQPLLEHAVRPRGINDVYNNEDSA